MSDIYIFFTCNFYHRLSLVTFDIWRIPVKGVFFILNKQQGLSKLGRDRGTTSPTISQMEPDIFTLLTFIICYLWHFLAHVWLKVILLLGMHSKAVGDKERKGVPLTPHPNPPPVLSFGWRLAKNYRGLGLSEIMSKSISGPDMILFWYLEYGPPTHWPFRSIYELDRNFLKSPKGDPSLSKNYSSLIPLIFHV